MDFLAHIGVTISLFLTSIFGSVLGLFHISQPPAATKQIPVTRTIPTKVSADTTYKWVQISSANNSANLGVKFDSQSRSIYVDFPRSKVLFPGADLDSFMVYAPISTYQSQDGSLFAKDKNHVYSACFGDPDCTDKAFVISEADPSTFSVLGLSGGLYYSKDKNHVYFTIGVLNGADPGTFVFVPGTVGRSYDAQDKNHKYLNGQIVQSDSQTSVATPLATTTFNSGGNTCYTKDNQNAYCYGEIVKGADLTTFQPLGLLITEYGSGYTDTGAYAKDKSRIYYGAHIIAKADWSTFKVVSPETNVDNVSFDASDRNHKYFRGDVVCEDATKQTCRQEGFWNIWLQNTQ